MAEDLNGYFSSVFTKEDISSLSVADAKFQGAKSDYLSPLVVTPELVAKKIKAMKDNKSPGVDGIPPKLLMKTVEQISIPLARVVCKLLETLIRDHLVEFLVKHKLINTSQHGFLKARSCLNWKRHTEKISNARSKKVGILNKLKRVITTN